MYVADAIATRLAGATPSPFRFRYLHECVSLGRGDALVQFMHADERPSRHVLTGRPATWYKEVVLFSARWLFRWPGPYRLRRGSRPRDYASWTRRS
jgi:NADH dehydrogenase